MRANTTRYLIDCIGRWGEYDATEMYCCLLSTVYKSTCNIYTSISQASCAVVVQTPLVTLRDIFFKILNSLQRKQLLANKMGHMFIYSINGCCRKSANEDTVIKSVRMTSIQILLTNSEVDNAEAFRKPTVCNLTTRPH